MRTISRSTSQALEEELAPAIGAFVKAGGSTTMAVIAKKSELCGRNTLQLAGSAKQN
jgi:hypothetical protein